ncbi:hypothetical protein FA95DRAFT_1575008 [Auriscalpium vulgare]|uniref:Uncharacterized protein n=1 Tax=Auriscalpium vulgare TaxID=40419 RepID=A0ACB8RJ00_9AGAM|nr:hypothetical protein FA95DRAFT_1575008 [Auriscalpium vulgare]
MPVQSTLQPPTPEFSQLGSPTDDGDSHTEIDWRHFDELMALVNSKALPSPTSDTDSLFGGNDILNETVVSPPTFQFLSLPSSSDLADAETPPLRLPLALAPELEEPLPVSQSVPVPAHDSVQVRSAASEPPSAAEIPALVETSLAAFTPQTPSSSPSGHSHTSGQAPSVSSTEDISGKVRPGGTNRGGSKYLVPLSREAFVQLNRLYPQFCCANGWRDGEDNWIRHALTIPHVWNVDPVLREEVLLPACPQYFHESCLDMGTARMDVMKNHLKKCPALQSQRDAGIKLEAILVTFGELRRAKERFGKWNPEKSVMQAAKKAARKLSEEAARAAGTAATDSLSPAPAAGPSRRTAQKARAVPSAATSSTPPTNAVGPARRGRAQARSVPYTVTSPLAPLENAVAGPSVPSQPFPLQATYAPGLAAGHIAPFMGMPPQLDHAVAFPQPVADENVFFPAPLYGSQPYTLPPAFLQEAHGLQPAYAGGAQAFEPQQAYGSQEVYAPPHTLPPAFVQQAYAPLHPSQLHTAQLDQAPQSYAYAPQQHRYYGHPFTLLPDDGHPTS